MNVNVVGSYFYSISKTGNGAVICVTSDVYVFVSFSSFCATVATEHGGAIFTSPLCLSLKKTYFSHCYSSKQGDGSGLGNAAYNNKGRTIIEYCSTFKCGPNSSKCSDSSIRCDAKTRVSSLNATSNYGCGGGAGISILDPYTGSHVRFLNVIDAHDNFVIESRTPYEALLCNFINTSACNYAFYYGESEKSIVFNRCTFINMKTPFTTTKSYGIVNCYSDANITSFTYVSSPNTVFIWNENFVTCKKKNNFSNRHVFIISLLMFVSKWYLVYLILPL